MFDELQQLKKLKELKDALEKEKREIEREGIRVVINGKMEIEEIRLNPQLDFEKQGEIIKDCINEAMKQIQKEVARKMLQV